MVNMKPTWLVEDFEADNSFGNLAEEVRRQGMECEVITYLPFQSGSYDVYGDEDCVLIQGSINLVQQLQRDKKWIPGAWLTPKAFECTTYYAHLGKYLFNDRYVILPRAEVARRMSWLLKDCFGTYEQLFMRPNSGLKTFNAGLFPDLNWSSAWAWVEDYTEPESLIIISTPKIIKAEWRFICTKDEVVTGCQYELGGEFIRAPGYPEAAKELAKEIAGVYHPEPMFVVDICQDADDNYALMEIGSFSVAGLYACETEPIVRVASDLAVKEFEEYQKI